MTKAERPRESHGDPARPAGARPDRARRDRNRTNLKRLDLGRIGLWTIVILGAVTILAVGSALPAAAFGVPVVFSLILAAGLAGSMVLSLVRPTLATVLVVVSVLGFALVTPPSGPWPIMVPSIIALAVVVLLVSRTRWLIGLIAVLVTGAGGMVIAIASPTTTDVSGAATADLIVFVSIAAAAWLIGLLIGKWAAVRAQLLRERAISAAELVRREAVEQRTELARELHDVVAHGMSAIQVQASSARYRIPGLSETAAAEFDEIAGLARSSMREMRALLAVLRSEDATGQGVPQPTAADVPDLVAAAVRSGSRIELDDRLTVDERAALDPVVSLTLYRVVQESLSNVARHATGADTLVTIEVGDAGLFVQVRNGAATGNGGGDLAVPDAGGNGIRGMRERVTLLGGTLEAEHTDDGGFVVRAAIPLNGQKELGGSTDPKGME
ncbi:sensor histidine kinase [Planctomonas sp. JC2975]|uniref:sensor histidine kinase n=1 Tax=Planctomonas sp. JC2975 TaxID=2729626 RepID=UPI0014736F4E|nr:histidine kinase [Planctomonas sp. JC2975]NNC13060.1 sensor histidine kinase [Planctomonas sp. JC2975]